MANLRIKLFGALAPRLDPHLLKETQAQVAHDVKLWHGGLHPWRQPRKVQDVPVGTRTVYPFGCCWLTWPRCVDVAEGSVECRRIFVTGDGAPKVATVEGCVPTWSRLGVPCPANAPSATAAEGYTKDTEARAYCYTYRNRFGEEGAPSFPSNSVDVISGTAVVVSGLQAPDAEWGIDSICIYRAITQHETGREAGNDLATEWMRVGELAVGVSVFVDNLDGAELTESVILENISPPPAGLRGITFISNTNCLAGFVGNKVYFSENGFYHDWPEKNVMALDDRVRALRESGGNLFVATDGHPYLIKADPDCDGDGCRAAKRYETAYPMVQCCSSKSAVAIPGGMLYPSHNGLVAMLGGEPTLMSWASFAPDNWQALHPDQLVGPSTTATILGSPTTAGS